jgi:hypothetical protein
MTQAYNKHSIQKEKKRKGCVVSEYNNSIRLLLKFYLMKKQTILSEFNFNNYLYKFLIYHPIDFPILND